MTTIQNVLIAAVSGLIAGLIVLHFAPVNTKVVQLAGASPAGASFSSRKIAGVSFIPSTVAIASSTSLGTNNDGNDRIITSVEYSCAGLGALSQTYANWTFQIATSSNTTFPSTASFVLNTTVATTSPEVFVSSSTPGYTTGAAMRRWKAGANLLVQSNSTSTATCTVVAGYIAT